ncbi:uncharacterized protein LOC143465769 [Clavelina lepadiformis]|uniref:uncharacterized protein LOC143465769 n=1 Tax=Clavelina lepadiformis TaxID=159417 RepID=UPI004041BC1F
MTSQLKDQKTAFLFFIFIAGLLATVAQDKLDEKTLETFRRSDEFDDVTEKTCVLKKSIRYNITGRCYQPRRTTEVVCMLHNNRTRVSFSRISHEDCKGFDPAGPVRPCRETSFYRVNVPGICLLKKGESTYSCKGINLTQDHHYHCLEFTRPIVTTARTNASCMTVCGKSVLVLVLIVFIYIHNAHLL